MTDRQFLRAFEMRTLPFKQWTHRAHVKVAFLYLKKFRFDRALEKIASAIRAYNAANKVPESPTSGYNQTTTHAFLHLVAATIAAYEPAFPSKGADAFCDAHPQLMTRHALRLFYSPQRRMHPEAKAKFVAPDLAPLPTIRRPRRIKPR
jgi:hypothetical protein